MRGRVLSRTHVSSHSSMKGRSRKSGDRATTTHCLLQLPLLNERPLPKERRFSKLPASPSPSLLLNERPLPKERRFSGNARRPSPPTLLNERPLPKERRLRKPRFHVLLLGCSSMKGRSRKSGDGPWKNRVIYSGFDGGSERNRDDSSFEVDILPSLLSSQV